MKTVIVSANRDRVGAQFIAPSDIHPDIARLNSIFARHKAEIKADAAREIFKGALIVAATAALALIFWRTKAM